MDDAAFPLKPLPPLGAVRAFEATARLGSMQRAAAELRITPSAVSHRIRELEAALQVRLFIREPRRISLTSEGAAFFSAARGALRSLAEAASAARSKADQATIRVSALPFFTANWLVPRLARFRSEHPTVQIEVSSTNRLVDLESEGVDVAIRNSPTAPPGLPCRKLLDVRGLPVCAPQLQARLARPTDLVRHTLIHNAARSRSWSEWLALAGCPGLEPAGGRRARGGCGRAWGRLSLRAADLGYAGWIEACAGVFGRAGFGLFLLPRTPPRAPAAGSWRLSRIPPPGGGTPPADGVDRGVASARPREGYPCATELGALQKRSRLYPRVKAEVLSV